MFGYKIKWVTNEIAVGRAPGSARALKTVRNAGIEVILNLCAECGDLHELERQAGFIVYWLPISDALAPEFDEMDEALTWLADQINEGKKVLIHCRFGVGRSGTVVAAYLLKRGKSIAQVMEIMKKTSATPTSKEQQGFIRDYSEKLGVILD